MNKKTYFIPDYIIKFQCSMCGDCCKRNWTVPIDQHTYEAYKKLIATDGKFAMKANGYIKETKNGSAALNFKKTGMKLIKTQDKNIENTLEKFACPFLNDDDLCSIQRAKGIELLCDVCKSYPRLAAFTDRGIEMSLVYSCLTAAELLKQKEAIEFFHVSEGYEFANLHNYVATIRNNTEKYFELEELLIDIIQNREMSIETRLSIIGVFIESIISKGNLFFEEYKGIHSTNFLEDVKQILPDIQLMISVVESVLRERFNSSLISDDRLVEMVIGVINDFTLFSKEITLDEKTNKFVEGYKNFYKLYRYNLEHIYENYFVNFVFSKRFFQNKYIDAYFLMVLLYVLIKFFTVYKCMHENKCVDEDVLVSAVSTVDLLLAHDESSIDRILDLAKNIGYKKVSKLISIINI